MDSTRVSMRGDDASATAGTTASAGGGDLGALDAHGLMPAHAGDLPAVEQVASGRRWTVRGARLVRNALVALAVMTLVPIALVAVRGGALGRMVFRTNSFTAARVAAVRPMRAFMVDRDPSIPAIEAGARLNALQYRKRAVPGFEAIVPDLPPALPWRTMQGPQPRDLFPNAQPNTYGTAASWQVLEAAATGLTVHELMTLGSLAHAPVWRDFDLIARAPAVDIIGGMFRLPFGDRARPEQRPPPSYKETKEVAYAAVSRAAYHVAMGQRDSAEAVLRSIVSLGFMYIDNGTETMDVLAGSVIVGIGRDALQRFYRIEHDPRAALPALRAPASVETPRPDRDVSPEAARSALLARIADPAAPFAERFEGARVLPLTPCTNLRELVFGPRPEVVATLAIARRDLRRFPSQRALFDLDQRLLDAADVAPSRPFRSLAVSSAAVAGAVLRNPRLVTCTRLLAGSQ